MADHAVSNQGVSTIKEAVAKIKLIVHSSFCGWKLLIFMKELGKALQQIELFRLVHVNAHKFTRLAPDTFRQGLDIRNGLIKTRRRNVEPMSLPIPKQFPRLRTREANRHHRSDESGKLLHANVSPCDFVRNFAEHDRC